jgi:hypothetical protein
VDASWSELKDTWPATDAVNEDDTVFETLWKASGIDGNNLLHNVCEINIIYNHVHYA